MRRTQVTEEDAIRPGASVASAAVATDWVRQAAIPDLH